MPLFMIERNFAEQLDLSADDLTALGEINSEVGVKWVYSFLSADKRRTYCLYEAGSVDAIREAAQRAGLPADVVIELAGQVHPPGEPAGQTA
ncbi:MAG: DUF4242 domain-containing protein [Gammaproteobacteria bacterium]|nr:DUF4242 domain-containing protein [Gammaproteobacteria bacterium]